MKKLFILFMTAIMLTSLTACVGPMNRGVSGSRPEGTTTLETLEETNKDSSVVSSATALALAQTVSVADVCEFYVDYTNITKDVMPPTPGSFYSHYEAEDGKVYVDLCVSYKNLEATDVNADEIMKAVLIYGGQYEYSGFSMIEEENRSDFTYSNITSIAPLSTEYLHYLFEVPEEVESSDWDIKIIFMIEGSEYEVVVRDGSTGATASQSENAGDKTGGEVQDGEVIAVNGKCEFSVDYSAVTAKVMPPVPGDFYSYYEAEDGKVYVDFCIAYKNLEAGDKAADEVVNAKLTYAGKYEYTGFSMIEEDGRGDFTYANITAIAPLSTEYVHILFEVPAEVETSQESIEVLFNIGGNIYTYKVR